MSRETARRPRDLERAARTTTTTTTTRDGAASKRTPPLAGLTSSTLVLRPVLEYARTRGIDVDALMTGVGVTTAALDDPDVRVPETVREQLWHEAAAQSGDPAFGLHAARHYADGALDVVDYAVSFSRTLLDGMERLVRFARILSDALAMELTTKAGRVRLRRLVNATDLHEQDAVFAVAVARMRQISGRAIRPRLVALAHTAHAGTEHAAFFRSPVRFGGAVSELVFDAADLALPLPASRPRLVSVLDRHAADLLARLPAEPSCTAFVRRAVVDAMGREPPSLARVARAMRVSPRTLQRRLRDEGTTHQRVVDECRRELATRYLTGTSLSITEIAYLLGFEEESGFRRQFRRWTGKSPSRYRGEATRGA